MKEKEGGGLNQPEVKRRHILPKALVTGIVAGLVASFFRLTLSESEHLRENLLHSLPRWPGLFLAVFGGATLGGLALWLVRTFAPEASGSGIPHLQSVISEGKPIRWQRILPVKFISGVLGISGGLALGREGPTVQMGGATGMMVAGLFRIKTGFGEKKALISAGAGAGLAAAFNAPLAGMIFVIEELQRSFTPVIFVAAFLACVSGDIVARLLVGDAPVFQLHEVPPIPLAELPFALLLGLIAGFGGVFFNRCVLASLSAFEKLPRQSWLPGALAGAIAGFAAWTMPGLAGGGEPITSQAVAGKIAFGMLPVFLIARFALTMTSYGCGTAGGIFAPMLVIGSIGGLLLGASIESLWPAALTNPKAFAVLGMGALFTAIVRAPLTGVVLMIEMTGHYEFMLPLLVCCLTAYGVAERMNEPPLYEALRLRRSR